MMSTRLVRLVAAAVPVAALMSVFITTAQPVSAQRATACVISGSASINPALQLVPMPSVWSFSGVAEPCGGVQAVVGPFAGDLSCPAESLVGCLPSAALNLTSSPWGACSGDFLRQGIEFSFQCDQGANAVAQGAGILTSNNGTTLPIASLNFTGLAIGVNP